MGYSRAGFDDIVGVDKRPQPNYPFLFVLEDALNYLAHHGHEFDAIHASPPCQGYSIMNNLPWLKDRDYPHLILPTIEMMKGLGKPYVLENVMGAQYGAKGLKKQGLESHGLKAHWLCGGMFGLPFYRHRLFATNWFWMQPWHPKHMQRIRSEESQAGHPNPVNTPLRVNHDGHSLASVQGNGAQAYGVGIGHAAGWRKAAEAMGIDWMKQAELTQAVPPAYAEFIGERLMGVLETGGKGTLEFLARAP